MQSVTQYRFYELGVKLHAITGCAANMRALDLFSPLMEAQTILDALIKGDPVTLSLAKPDANKLLSKLSALFNRYFIDPASKQFRMPTVDEKIDQHEISLLRALLQKFEMSFAAELSRMPAYGVGKQGIFSTEELVENADGALSDAVREMVSPDVLADYKAAGRAIAFGLGSAAVMHLLRAIERVMVGYYESFGSAPMGPKIERNWNNTIKRLNALCDETLDSDADRRIVQLLTQIRERYRNPLTQSDVDYLTDDALTLFNLGGSVMSMMVEQMMARADKEKTRGELRANHNRKTIAEAESAAEDDYREIYEFRLPQSA